eukprot:Pompholyxophrys_punicea_v1_NODE_904_length_1152_cov_23.420237.p2 type:complete len:109 gc:universal NODE_904_length_1152_cov_23.420237:313-639(+)
MTCERRARKFRCSSSIIAARMACLSTLNCLGRKSTDKSWKEAARESDKYDTRFDPPMPVLRLLYGPKYSKRHVDIGQKHVHQQIAPVDHCYEKHTFWNIPLRHPSDAV